MKHFISVKNAISLILVIGVSAAFASFTEEELIADAGVLGKIKGVNSTTSGSSPRPYIAFLGIKYAEPPTGEKRFLPSVIRKSNLTETGDYYDAKTAGPSCIQPVMLLPVVQSEDCLTINVNTPKPYKGNDSELLPVIFFIHGGGFTVGSGDAYDGKRLMNKDVVLVNFNYRLGVLGFFSLQTENVPGNAALYDVINALKWTKEFVKYFNGDPNRITIAGQSAGSVVVTHLLATPAARGLFQGAIGASGTALAAWGTTVDPVNDSLIIAEMSNCYNRTGDYASYEEMIETVASCMRNAPYQTLVNNLMSFQMQERREGRLGFGAVSPTVQSFETNETSNFEKILTEHPHDIFESGRQANVPLMMGSTRHDGSYVLGVVYNRFFKDNGHVNATDSDYEFMSKEAIPSIMRALGIPNDYGVFDSIAKMYLGNSRKSGDFYQMYPGFIDLFSVFFFKASSYQTALFHCSVNSNTYWYSFDYKGSFSSFPFLFGTEIPPFPGGITHGDDMIYLFEMLPISIPPQDRLVSNKMVDYWANFATYGNPTPDQNGTLNPNWPQLNENNAKFLSIGQESVELEHYDDGWSDIGWEVLPPTEPPSTSTTSGTPTTTSSGTTTTQSSSSTTPATSDSTSGSSITQSTSSTTPSTSDSTSGDTNTTPSSTGRITITSSCKYLTFVFLLVNIIINC